MFLSLEGLLLGPPAEAVVLVEAAVVHLLSIFAAVECGYPEEELMPFRVGRCFKLTAIGKCLGLLFC